MAAYYPRTKINNETNFLSEFESLQDAEQFVSAFNRFYSEINFDDYLNRYKPYYDKMISEMNDAGLEDVEKVITQNYQERMKLWNE